MIFARARFLRPVALLLLGVLVAGCTAGGSNSSTQTTTTATPASMDHAAHMAGMMDATPTSNGVTSPGQEAFGAIQEVVAALEADPTTDWSKVNISALREHLVDMDEVTLRANVDTHDVPGGFEASVTGEGRTVGAIQRMLTAHSLMGLSSKPEWHASVQNTPSGATMAVTTVNASDVQHLRALGFFGVMVTGAHHQEHHLMIARGEMMH